MSSGNQKTNRATQIRGEKEAYLNSKCRIMENRKISKVKRLNLRSVYSKQTMCRNCSWSWDIKELDCLVHMMDHRLNTWGSLDDWSCIHKLPKNLSMGGNPESVLSFILSKWTGERDSVNYSHGINIGGSKMRRDEMLEPKNALDGKPPKSSETITKYPESFESTSLFQKQTSTPRSL